MKFQKYRCKKCKSVFVAMSDRHRMDYCPGVGNYDCESYVDLEEDYVRISGVEFVESFDPPWFDDEDDYRSALLTWLNDSDEEFTLEKPEPNLLLVLRMDGDGVEIKDGAMQVSDTEQGVMVGDPLEGPQKSVHVHEWRLVCIGEEARTYVCHTCRMTKRVPEKEVAQFERDIERDMLLKPGMVMERNETLIRSGMGYAYTDHMVKKRPVKKEKSAASEPVLINLSPGQSIRIDSDCGAKPVIVSCVQTKQKTWKLEVKR